MRGIRESLTRWKIEAEAPGRDAGAVLLREPPGARWLARFFGALLAERPILLLAAETPEAERAEVDAWLEAFPLEPGEILIPTGGTSGRRRWARHGWETLSAAADGFLEFFGPQSADAVSVLPTHHVGGLMAFVRAVRGGGRVVMGDYREIGKSLELPPGVTVSLVPTQLRRLLRQPAAVEALREAGRILLGGARAEPELLEAAREARLPLAPSYGMTESAALITALRPKEFLGGAGGVGEPLPHVELEWGELAQREDLPDDLRRLGVRSSALCAGYWPPPEEAFPREPWWTPDLALIDDTGQLQILGRTDRVVISGGENVDADRVEAVMRGCPGVEALAVLGVPHPEWGEQLVAGVVPGPQFDRLTWKEWAQERLSPPERPKQTLLLEELPRTALGKLDRRALLARFDL